MSDSTPHFNNEDVQAVHHLIVIMKPQQNWTKIKFLQISSINYFIFLFIKYFLKVHVSLNAYKTAACAEITGNYFHHWIMAHKISNWRKKKSPSTNTEESQGISQPCSREILCGTTATQLVTVKPLIHTAGFYIKLIFFSPLNIF